MATVPRIVLFEDAAARAVRVLGDALNRADCETKDALIRSARGELIAMLPTDTPIPAPAPAPIPVLERLPSAKSQFAGLSFADILADGDLAAELFASAVHNAKRLYPRLVKAFMRGSAGVALFGDDDFLLLEALEYLHDEKMLSVAAIRFIKPQPKFLLTDAATVPSADELAADAEAGELAEADKKITEIRERGL